VKLLLTVLVPNLTKDEEQTKLQAQQAAAEVKPVMVKVYKGDTIIRKGERIRAWNLEVLEEYHLIRREINWKGLLCLTVAVGVSVEFLV
jgi:membrane-associated HD superfamily phosphohydrolase